MARHLTYRRPGRRPAKALIISIAVLAILVVAAGFLLSDFFLNWYAKGKIEKAFAEAYPGSSLTIGSLHFSIPANRVECRASTVVTSDASLRCSAGVFTVSGIGWRQLLVQRELTPEVMKTSTLTAGDVVLRLAYPRTEIRCGGLRISVPDSEVTASGASIQFEHARYSLTCELLRVSARDSEVYARKIDLRPLAGDEDFFNARPFRRTRFSLTIEHCRLRRAPLLEMLKAKSMPGGSLDIVRPELSLLVNREKPSNPNAPPPQMPGAALSKIGRTFRLDTLLLHNGRLLYAERVAAGGKPGVLTFDTVQVALFNVSNAPGAVALLRAQGRFLNEGLMRVVMHIPLSPESFALSYTGSLTAMDFTALNRFLTIAEHTRIESAMLHKAEFAVRVSGTHASGTLHMDYDNLSIQLIDKESGSEKGLGKRLESIFANIKIRGSNTPNQSDGLKVGTVEYTREPDDTFMNVTWLSLRSAVKDVVGF